MLHSTPVPISTVWSTRVRSRGGYHSAWEKLTVVDLNTAAVFETPIWSTALPTSLARVNCRRLFGEEWRRWKQSGQCPPVHLATFTVLTTTYTPKYNRCRPAGLLFNRQDIFSEYHRTLAFLRHTHDYYTRTLVSLVLRFPKVNLQPSESESDPCLLCVQDCSTHTTMKTATTKKIKTQAGGHEINRPSPNCRLHTLLAVQNCRVSRAGASLYTVVLRVLRSMIA